MPFILPLFPFRSKVRCTSSCGQTNPHEPQTAFFVAQQGKRKNGAIAVSCGALFIARHQQSARPTPSSGRRRSLWHEAVGPYWRIPQQQSPKRPKGPKGQDTHLHPICVGKCPPKAPKNLGGPERRRNRAADFLHGSFNYRTAQRPLRN